MESIEIAALAAGTGKMERNEHRGRPGHSARQCGVGSRFAHLAQQYVERDRSRLGGLNLFQQLRMDRAVPRPFADRREARIID